MTFAVELAIAFAAGFVLGLTGGWIAATAHRRWADRNQPPPF